jgi:gliding motility-associated-like protein
MPNGSGLLGNTSANQPVVISPVPSDSTKFFIFTNNANFTTGGSIAVSLVDLMSFGGAVFPVPPLGDITTPKNVAIASLANRSEGMTIIPHANGKDYWLITHQNGSQNYSATLINKASFTGGTFNTTVSSGLGLPTSVANFSYNRKLKKLAVSAQDANTDAIILTFDDNTGVLTFDRYIYNTGKTTTQPQSIYDIQWDQAGQYLYISRVGEPGPGPTADVLQYDYLNSNNNATLLTSVLKTPEVRSWGLQLAPDSAIYHIYQDTLSGKFKVKKFTKTDTIASSVIETLPFGYIDFKGTQFPAFIPKIKMALTLSFTSVGTCQNNNTTFFPTVLPNADSLHWDFGDTTSVTAWSPVHKFKMAKTYNVTLTAYYQGNVQTVTQPVTMNPFLLKLQLVQDTTACRSEFPPPRGSSTPKQFSVTVKASGGTVSSYNWSNGQTGATLKPDSAGYYYVVATDGSGCSTYAGVTVKEYGKIDQRSNIWYFGTKAGIDFNKRPPKALNTSAMDAPAGCAIICDRNGQTIFYTDGNQVWDKTNTSIATGIGGDPNSSQSALIIPVPGDETLYYIFTTQAINGVSGNELRYSLFDLKMNGGKGGIVQKDVLLFAKSTERITGNNQWLIAHEYGNNTFRSYQVTAQGLGDPVYSAIGSVHSFQVAANGEGYMKLGPKNNLAVAFSTPGVSNWVELFHLNDSTGTLSYYRKIDLKHPAGQVYGIEFSPGGNKVFASIMDTPNSNVFEYSIDSVGHTHLKKDNVEAGTIGALQIAPDNQIYMAIKGSSTLGTILADEDTTKISAINLAGFTLAAGTKSTIGLPNFRQQQSSGFGGPGFTFTGICFGDSTKFVGTPTDAIDKFEWFFPDDRSGSNKATPSHLFKDTLTYTISMRLTNRCGLDTTITHQVKINPSPAKPSLPFATPICTTPVTLNANAPGTKGLTYSWSTGDTTKTITIAKPSSLSVTNTDKKGCSSTAAGIVVDNRPKLVLGPDLTVCQNNATAPLDAQNPGDNYAWTITNVTTGTSTPGSTSQFQAVDTTVPGIFNYTVVISDPITSCQLTAQKKYTVIQSPVFTMAGTNPTPLCSSTNGTISLTGVSSPSLYSYFISGPGGFNKQGIDQSAGTQGPFTSPPPIGAGTYTGIMTDQVSGCTISHTFGLSNSSVSLNSVVNKTCDPPKIDFNPVGFALPLTYLITYVPAGQTSTTSLSGTANTNTFQLPLQGSPTTVTYTVQLSDNVSGCTATKNVTVSTPALPPLSITPPGCSNTVTANGALTYSWSSNIAGSIVGSSTANSVTLTPGIGAVTLTVIGTDASGCSSTLTQQVYISPTIAPAFTQSDPCQTRVVLSASPIGNYTYRWYKGGVLQPGLIGQQIVLGLSENGASYQAEIVDAQSGCAIKSPPTPVKVTGQITASVTATLACQDGKPFTLTATTNAINPTYTWLLNSGPIAGATTSTLQQTTEGVYEVDVSLATCKAIASIQIIRAPIPQGILPPGAIICNDPDNKNPATSKVDLDPGFFSAYNWFKNNVTLNYTSRVYTADSQGSYRVDITNAMGCTNSDKTDVTNDCEPIVTGPNVFRPNSNTNENKNFHLFTFFITDNFEVIVYNRWGEPVFEAKDKNFQWNGGYKNNLSQPLPGGTYVYLVRYVSTFHPDQGVQEYRAGVVLLR